MPGFFSKESIIAPVGFNRWRVPPASICIHLCIGSVYAWTSFNTPLTRIIGVAAPAADDWNLSSVVGIFTMAIVSLGLSAAAAGSWLERVGPRTVGLVAACCWGGGFLVGGIGILLHELWLIYLGYGVIGGIGLGLGYVSPVSTLIRWFPDRRGMATGMAIMGFGGGAILGAPLKEALIRHYYQPPQYVGPTSEVALTTAEGRQFAFVNQHSREVLVVDDTEAKSMTVPGRAGVYLVGTGSAGIAETFFTLGTLYFSIMVLAALTYRIPAADWKPAGWTAPDPSATQRKMMSQGNVAIQEAMRTPQFYLVWIVLCFNVTAGIGILSVAKEMMSDLFRSSLPQIVTSDFAKMYVVMISVFNCAGRFAWASASDYLGRQRTYSIFLILGTLLYLSIPWTAHQMVVQPSIAWLVIFYTVTMFIFSLYGGGFATIPAYLADLFGTQFVGGIHGRLLTAWSVAGALGPLALTSLRSRSLAAAIHDLASKVSPERFEAQFHAPLAELPELVQAKTVTISKLLALCPLGTPDPSSGLYNSTMYLMAALLAVAAVANASIRPVDPKHYLKNEPQPETA